MEMAWKSLISVFPFVSLKFPSVYRKLYLNYVNVNENVTHKACVIAATCILALGLIFF